MSRRDEIFRGAYITLDCPTDQPVYVSMRKSLPPVRYGEDLSDINEKLAEVRARLEKLLRVRK